MKKTKQLNNTSVILPAIGQGMGDYPWDENQISVLREGIDLGMNLIDTAENYDNGNSETIIGKAIKGIREKVIICTKFAPEHNSYNDVLTAVEGSLKRLKTDYIDIYQMHWPNPKIPFKKTMEAMEKLVCQGKIKYIGLSNLYLEQIKEVQKALDKNKIYSFQVEYNFFDRFIENNILPYCEKEKIITIAYSPLDQGRIIPEDNDKLKIFEKIAEKYNKTIAQIALNWLIAHPVVIAIPTANRKYIKENAGAADFEISKEDFNKISDLYNAKPSYIQVDKIEVSAEGQSNRMVYKTIEQAIENKLNFVPSPNDLAQYFKNNLNEEIKPVRLIKGEGDKYQLVEGRVRYWAWVIAHNGEKPITAYIRKKL
ncbi:MAG: hypothetical protein A2626_00770 [Candidatus Nealsonbacteria bacterium RIFCSPHIGHO2_01_FULL_38_55]|uniref:NADP-dependent oxidoreductase domain-containing protein n=1 Tax=Candidatus Nealsonbacteria bacterium RIFCSPHIGHO2_01_FULL_38_55 TaxID=1801664 RepID=A0A1G2E263_9BACT|nr:MAG: hypothetical protein A2626_00770 [Candidatus Nealsonbacteria bacterium RIFCSPHIGHO2_01_FULL_38_55]OGZ22016.1 MAG: hypothetical protein A3C48_03340 [Candidatus Nealsonbacteria bacterium RIFCSPHIGHO2_02_FULL_38_75]